MVPTATISPTPKGSDIASGVVYINARTLYSDHNPLAGAGFRNVFLNSLPSSATISMRLIMDLYTTNRWAWYACTYVCMHICTAHTDTVRG